MLPSCHHRCSSRLALSTTRSPCDPRPRLSGERVIDMVDVASAHDAASARNSNAQSPPARQPQAPRRGPFLQQPAPRLTWEFGRIPVVNISYFSVRCTTIAIDLLIPWMLASFQTGWYIVMWWPARWRLSTVHCARAHLVARVSLTIYVQLNLIYTPTEASLH